MTFVASGQNTTAGKIDSGSGPRRNVAWLKGLTVVDITAGGALLCGKILADLGAEVVLVEKPSGHQSRNRGPFYHDEPGRERSLFWFAYCAGKKSITLDIESSEGGALLRRLLHHADIVLESYAPGHLTELGLDYDSMRLENPSLIMTSITPFGQSGPYRGFRSCDLVTTALGGFLSLCGDPDRAPLRISFPQAMLHAGAHGAAATLIAQRYRTRTGKGQHVDVSAQQCMAWAMVDAQTWWHASRVNISRSGQYTYRPSSTVSMRTIWPCKTGYVLFWILGGPMGAGSMSRLTEWMTSEGEGDPLMEATNWPEFDFAGGTQEFFNHLEQAIGPFFQKRAAAEVVEEARRRDILIGPVATMKELCATDQLRARRFWPWIYHPNLQTGVQYVAPFVRPGECVTDSLPPPELGEHCDDIYGARLDISPAQLGGLKSASVI